MNAAVLKFSAAVLGLLLSLPTAAAEVDRRAGRQQERIAPGARNGSPTAGQAAGLERREIKTDRSANGSSLTPAEQAKLNRPQNHPTRAIHHRKHSRRFTQ